MRSNEVPAMRHTITLLSIIAALALIGCDEADRESIEQGRESLDRATQSLKRAGESLKRAGESAAELAADAVLPPKKEEQLGDRMAREIMAESQMVTDKPVSEYVEKLGASVVAAAEDRPAEISFEFHVIRDESINAFAIPGGHIFVTTGLLEAAETEAELVAVLGHELAHVTERHIARRMSAAYGISLLTQLALGQESGELEQIVADVLGQGFLLKHSRDDEREADETGMKYVIEAGYSPVGYAAFFDSLAGQSRPPALLSTHPDPEERAQRAQEAIEKLDQAIVDRPVHRERYQKATSSL
jgi:predicted Zn-dependent protease